jgi:hypothetical protein
MYSYDKEKIGKYIKKIEMYCVELREKNKI